MIIKHYAGVPVEVSNNAHRKTLRDGGRRIKRASIETVQVGQLTFGSEWAAKRFIRALSKQV